MLQLAGQVVEDEVGTTVPAGRVEMFRQGGLDEAA